MDQDAQNHFSHFLVMKYQDEALDYFGEGPYKVSLNVESLYWSACSLAYNEDKNAGSNH